MWIRHVFFSLVCEKQLDRWMQVLLLLLFYLRQVSVYSKISENENNTAIPHMLVDITITSVWAPDCLCLTRQHMLPVMRK